MVTKQAIIAALMLSAVYWRLSVVERLAVVKDCYRRYIDKEEVMD